jgi:hypothetical protein
MVQIAVINESTAMTDDQVRAMIPAFETQWNRDLAPIWDLEQAQFSWIAKTQPAPASSWWVVFVDDSDMADALGYHELTESGFPLSKVLVKTIQDDGASVSVGATHEICEMAVDPTINLAAQDSEGTFWAYEVCDPVEDERYGYGIDGVLVTDFVTPAWFGFKNARGLLDFQGHAVVPFQVLANGYAQKWGPSGWTQVNGDRVAAAGKARALHAPPSSRRKRRAMQRSRWASSDTHASRNAQRKRSDRT